MTPEQLIEKEIDKIIYDKSDMALQFDWRKCDITMNSGKLVWFARYFFDLGKKAK